MRHVEELGTFLLQHSNSSAYLVSQLEAYLEAVRADHEAECAFAGGLLRAVKKEKGVDA